MIDRITVPDHVIVRQLGDESVMLDMASGYYFGLDPVGARIWQLLLETSSLAEIVERLAQEYDVTPEQAKSDLVRFVEELKAHGLLNVE
jgi:Coenzyme PQQ synthesis protein D (PqqD)